MTSTTEREALVTFDELCAVVSAWQSTGSAVPEVVHTIAARVAEEQPDRLREFWTALGPHRWQEIRDRLARRGLLPEGFEA